MNGDEIRLDHEMRRQLSLHADYDPRELGPALKNAIDVVKRGEPALIDVLTAGR